MKPGAMMKRIGLVAALGLALGAAMAQPGGPRGPGAGGYGCGPGCGYGPNGAAAVSLMTEQERAEHWSRMHSFASYDECKAYMTDFAKQMQQRATEKGTTFRGPNAFMCERMKDRGFFKQ